VPAYLENFTRTNRFVTALRDHCLVPGSLMMSDPAVIIYEQLQEPQTYESILSAVAAGFHQWSDIAKMAGLAATGLGHYLKLLQGLELLERRTPLLTKANSKQGRYYLRDPFLRFYYRFIVPQLGAIKRGYQEAAATKIEAELHAFLGTHVFEELCREWVYAAAETDRLPFLPQRVGGHWSATEQIDVVAVNWDEAVVLYGECKWKHNSLRNN